MYTRGSHNMSLIGTLYDQNYQLITSNVGGGELDNFRIVHTLNPGTYYVEVRVSSGTQQTGSYFFHLEGPPDKGTISDDHGFSAWSATPVSVGSVKDGVININGDLDYFSFTVTTPGTYVMYTRGSHNMSLIGTLYDQNYQSITSNVGGGELDNFRIVHTLNPGSYYVEVRVSSGTQQTGSYFFHLEGPPDKGTISDDHGFSAWSATPVSVGSVKDGVININGDLDYFSFTVTTPGTYVMYTRGSHNMSLIGTLYDQNYQSITSNVGGGELDNFRIVRTLNPGTYYVEVRVSSGTQQTGSYFFHLEGPPDKGTISDDHGFSAWSATPVSVGSVKDGVININGDLDYFSFTVTTPGTYVMYTRGSHNMSLIGTLYDQNYQSITSNVGGGELDNFRIVRTLNPGTYYVEVRVSSGTQQTGSYFFHLEGPPDKGTISDDHGFSAWSATPVSVGSVKDGVININGDLDYFSFTVTTPGTYVMYTRGSHNMSLIGTLYDQNYQSITSNVGGGELDNFRIVRTLNPGTYYVEVQGFLRNPTNRKLHFSPRRTTIR